MQRLFFALALMILCSAQAQAQAPTPLDYYQHLQGHWAADHGDIELTYSVGDNSVRIEGETCVSAQADLPRLCDAIEQSYQENGSEFLREDSNYGQRPVQVVEQTGTRLVTREVHPLSADHTVLTSEEQVDENTLHLVSETWVKGQDKPQSRRDFTLHRIDSGAALAF